MPLQRNGSGSSSHLLIGTFALAVLSGCSPYMRYPQLANPGPAQVQRADAVVFDPYPLDDVGPPVEGGRPAGYQRPVLESTRGRMYVDSIGQVPQTAPLFPSLLPQGPPLGGPVPMGPPPPAVPGQPAPFIAPPPTFPAAPSAAPPFPSMPWSPSATSVSPVSAGPTVVGPPIPTGLSPFPVPERPAIPPSSRRW